MIHGLQRVAEGDAVGLQKLADTLRQTWLMLSDLLTPHGDELTSITSLHWRAAFKKVPQDVVLQWSTGTWRSEALKSTDRDLTEFHSFLDFLDMVAREVYRKTY